jgi:hypothetical protein
VKTDETAALALFILLPCVAACALLFFARHRRRQKGPATWPELLAGNALALAFLASILLLGGELYFRFVFDSTDSFFFTKVSERWLQRHWHDNVLGVRDDVNYSFPLPAGRRRISFVGDSFTAGHGINHVDDRFVNILRRTHPDWEVHMLAQTGYDTGDELENLSKGLRHGYQLDQVVLVYCLNDVSDIMPAWAQAADRFKAELRKSAWLRRNSYFLDMVCCRWQVGRDPYMKNYFGFVAEAYRGPLWQKQQLRLKAFRDLVQTHGGRLCVVTFPFMHALGPNYEYRFIHQELDELWRSLKVPHLDLLPVYQDLPPRKLTVNRFDAHPNERAHALAAAAIDEFLTRQLQPLSAP